MVEYVRHRMIAAKMGGAGWVILAIYVLIWDVVAGQTQKETLSAAFWRASRHPVTKAPLVTVWVLTTGHLFGLIPGRVDPYRLLGQAIDQGIRRTRTAVRH